MQHRWERVGFTQEIRETYLADALEDDGMAGRYVDLVGACTPDNPAFSSEFGRKKDLDQLMMRLNTVHLEMQDAGGSAIEIATEMCKLGIDYFWGDWRNCAECEHGVLDRAQCRNELSWFDEFRMSVLAATLVGDWASLQKLGQFVDDDLRYDEGAWDYHREDNLAYMCFARFLSAGKLNEIETIALQVNKGRRVRAKLIVQGTFAILNGSASELESVIEKLAKHFIKGASNCEGLMISSWDASILCNIGVLKGMISTPLALPLADYLTTRDSVGW